MNTQSKARYEMHAYCLQPGDGTRYTFGFFEPHKAKMLFTVHSEKSEPRIYGNLPEVLTRVDEDPKVYDIFSGVGDGEDYIYMWIETTYTCFTWVPRWTLENLDHRSIAEIANRTKMNFYTMAAVLLALRDLINDPNDIQLAINNMLQAPKFVKEYNSYINEH